MDELKNLLTQYDAWKAYFVFAAILGGTSIGVPLSSDLLLIVSGVLVSLHFFEWHYAVPIAIAAVFVGDFIMYHIGYFYGEKILNLSLVRKVFTPAKQNKIKKVLTNNQKKYCSSIRFTPTLRCLLVLMAGTSRISMKNFVLIHYPITAIYIFCLISVTHFASDQAQRVFNGFQNISSMFTTALSFYIAYILIKKIYRNYISRGADLEIK